MMETTKSEQVQSKESSFGITNGNGDINNIKALDIENKSDLILENGIVLEDTNKNDSCIELSDSTDSVEIISEELEEKLLADDQDNAESNDSCLVKNASIKEQKTEDTPKSANTRNAGEDLDNLLLKINDIVEDCVEKISNTTESENDVGKDAVEKMEFVGAVGESAEENGEKTEEAESEHNSVELSDNVDHNLIEMKNGEEVVEKDVKEIDEKVAEEIDEKEAEEMEEKEAEEMEEKEAEEINAKEAEEIEEKEAEEIDEKKAENILEKEAEEIEEKEAEEIHAKEAEEIDENEAEKIDEKVAEEIDEEEVEVNGSEKGIEEETEHKTEREEEISPHTENEEKTYVDRVRNALEEVEKVGKNDEEKNDGPSVIEVFEDKTNDLEHQESESVVDKPEEEDDSMKVQSTEEKPISEEKEDCTEELHEQKLDDIIESTAEEDKEEASATKVDLNISHDSDDDVIFYDAHPADDDDVVLLSDDDDDVVTKLPEKTEMLQDEKIQEVVKENKKDKELESMKDEDEKNVIETTVKDTDADGKIVQKSGDVEIVECLAESVDVEDGKEVMEIVEENGKDIVETDESKNENNIIEIIEAEDEDKVVETVKDKYEKEVVETVAVRNEKEVIDIVEAEDDVEVLETAKDEFEKDVLELLEDEVEKNVSESVEVEGEKEMVENVEDKGANTELKDNEPHNEQKKVEETVNKESSLVAEDAIDLNKVETVEPKQKDTYKEDVEAEESIFTEDSTDIPKVIATNTTLEESLVSESSDNARAEFVLTTDASKTSGKEMDLTDLVGEDAEKSNSSSSSNLLEVSTVLEDVQSARLDEADIENDDDEDGERETENDFEVENNPLIEEEESDVVECEEVPSVAKRMRLSIEEDIKTDVQTEKDSEKPIDENAAKDSTNVSTEINKSKRSRSPVANEEQDEEYKVALKKSRDESPVACLVDDEMSESGSNKMIAPLAVEEITSVPDVKPNEEKDKQEKSSLEDENTVKSVGVDKELVSQSEKEVKSVRRGKTKEAPEKTEIKAIASDIPIPLYPPPSFLENPPPLRLDFLRRFQKSFDNLTRQDLEDLVMQKLVEALLYKSQFAEISKSLEKQEKLAALHRTKIAELSKHMRDLTMVHNRLLKDIETKNLTYAQPLKITRAVGLQVNIPKRSESLSSVSTSNANTTPNCNQRTVINLTDSASPKPTQPPQSPPQPARVQVPQRIAAGVANEMPLIGNAVNSTTTAPATRRGCVTKITAPRPAPNGENFVVSPLPVSNRLVQPAQTQPPPLTQLQHQLHKTAEPPRVLNRNASAAAGITEPPSFPRQRYSPVTAALEKQQRLNRQALITQRTQAQYKGCTAVEVPQSSVSSITNGVTNVNSQLRRSEPLANTQVTTIVQPNTTIPATNYMMENYMASLSHLTTGAISITPAKPKEKECIDLTDDDDVLPTDTTASVPLQQIPPPPLVASVTVRPRLLTAASNSGYGVRTLPQVMRINQPLPTNNFNSTTNNTNNIANVITGKKEQSLL